VVGETSLGNQLQLLIFLGNSQTDKLFGNAVSIPDGLAIYSRVPTGKQEMILLERKLVLQTTGWITGKSGFRRLRICF
jgi:hypothetical protein